MPNRSRRDVLAFGDGDVLGNIDDHRSGTAGGGDVERLVDDAREVVDVPHEVVVFGARPGDADGVRLLEGVVADEVRGHLTRQAHDGDTVHHRVGQPGHRVGRPRTRSHEDDAGFARRAGIPLRHVRRALLVPYEHVPDTVLLEYGIVKREYGAARIPEDYVDPLVLERPEDDPRSRHARV